METLELHVSGMSCSHCEAAVRDEVGRLDEVARVDANAARGLVTVDGVALDEARIRAAIVEAGYSPEP